jgi:type II secretion system protein D
MTFPVNLPWRWIALGVAAGVALAALVASKAAQAQSPVDVGPATAQAPVMAPTERNVVKVHRVAAERLDAIVARLQEEFHQQPQVRIIADQPNHQVVVVAPLAAHEKISQSLGEALAAAPSAPVAASPADTPSAPASAAPAAEPAAPARFARATHLLKHISTRDAEQSMAGIWAKTASFVTSRGGETTTVRIPAGKHSEAMLVVDHQRETVTIDAPQEMIDSWRRVVQSIDASPAVGDQQVGVVPFDRADPKKIQRAIQLVHAAGKNHGMTPSQILRGHGRREHIGQFVTLLFQPEGGQPPPAGQPQPGGEPQVAVEGVPGGAGTDVAGAISRIGNVQIEFVQGLDILIIRGNKRDVDLVKEIIKQIEELSVQTQPEVEIFYLQHVDGQQMTELINQIYATIFVSQSQVTLTPLIKPNAVLVIGRKEAIVPVIDLIRRLDQPVSPESQLRVFQLKYLPAVDAERTIRGLFTQRPGYAPDPRLGLGTRVLVLADFRSNSLIVQASPRDLEEVAELLKQLDVPDTGATNEVRVFKLKNSLAEELAPILQEAITGEVQGQQRQQIQQQFQGQQGGNTGTPTPASNAPRSAGVQMLMIDAEGKRIIQSGILSDFRVSSDARNNQLIITGPPQSMELMAELINQLDSLPGAEAQVKVFTIINGDATQLATMLQTLFGLQTGGQAGQLPFGAQSVTGSGETTLVPLRFAVDTRTNSIIATGSPGDLAVVYRILALLDEGGIRRRELKVYRLKNTSAEAVAGALNTFLQGQTQLQQAQGQLISALEALEERVIVVQEPVTNSLIVSATTRYLPEIEKIINDLDKRNPMVVIQLLIAEVTLSDLDEFGAEFGLQDSLLFQRGTPIPGFNFNNFPLGNTTTGVDTEHTAGQGLTNFQMGRTSSAAGFGGLVLSASSESVSILIRALQQSQRAQILSRPQIQTMDNQPAFVQVGAKVPRIQGQTVTNNNVTQDVVDVNVGVILGVTPRVTPDGMVVMEIDAEKSEVGPDETAIVIGTDTNGNPILSPQILTNLAQTTITARSGQTVILGGLISRTSGESTRRVPYLADVPVLGRLFRFDSTSLERRELLFILTPYIMDPPDSESHEIEYSYNQRETDRMSWCLADVVNIHGALPGGAVGSNYLSPQSPLIFPDETPAGPSILRPGELLQPTPLPPPSAYPPPAAPPPGAVPPGGAAPPPGSSPPPALPQSSRRTPPSDAEAQYFQRPWQPAAVRAQEVQRAMQLEAANPPASQPQITSPPAQDRLPMPAGLTPATISPAGFQEPAAPVDAAPERSIYEP